MPELVWIVDPPTGDLVVEGLEMCEVDALTADLLPGPVHLDCARPLVTATLPAEEACGELEPALRVESVYHGSVVEGPGRRSVVQLRGCPIRCRGCSVPHTHPSDGGVLLPVAVVVQALLDPIGEPRDGVTVLGGEPTVQPVGLTALLVALKQRGIHTVVYSGYTLEALARRGDSALRLALEHTDMLIDGPFVADLADGAGQWRGSRNQRIIERPARALASLG